MPLSQRHPSKQARQTRAVPDIDPSGKSLIIVESPAKAKTINKYLGKDFHRRGVGRAHQEPPEEQDRASTSKTGSSPSTRRSRGRTKSSRGSAHHARKAQAVYLATDPDREGEAIAWHIAEGDRGGQSQRLPRDVPSRSRNAGSRRR